MALIDEVIMGHVVQGGTGQAPGRQAAIGAGIPGTVPALTINKVCGSGLKAVMLAAQSIKAGDSACVVAGGQESMSTAPHYVYGMRNGIKAGNQTMVDGMIHDGLWDSFGGNHMGEYAEYTATKAGISRKDQDEFAYQSHRKAVAAQEAGAFDKEIVNVEIPGRSGPTIVSRDESPRKDTSLEALAKLKPAFVKDGTVTAGNAPGLNDGASALVVTSLAFAKAHGLTPMATDHRVRHRRRRTEGPLLRADPRGAEPDEEGRHHDRRVRPDRGERGVRGAGAGQWPRAGLGLGPGQREWRRDRAGPPHRGEWRPGAHDAPLRHEGPRREDRPRHAVPRRRQCRGAERGERLTDWRATAKAIGLVVLYLGLGLVLTALPFILYIRYATAPDTQALTGNSTALLLQGMAQLTVFGFLTWLLGHRVAGLSAAELGWAPTGRGKGFARGLVLAAVLALAALLLAVLFGGAHWLPDTRRGARLPEERRAHHRRARARGARRGGCVPRVPAGDARRGLRPGHRDRRHVAHLRPGPRAQPRGDARSPSATSRWPASSSASRSMPPAASGRRGARTSAGTRRSRRSMRR